MSAFDYSCAKGAVDRLIARFGQAGVLRRPTKSGTDYNPTAGAPQDHAVLLVVQEFRKDEIDGTRIRSTDKKVMVSVGDLAITPETSDKLVIGGVEHAIIMVTPLSPGATVLLFEMQARK